MHVRTVALALGMVVAVAARAAAQRSEPSVIVALRTEEPIRLDGRLDEPAWQRAVRISNFTQRELDFGAPVSERTEVALLTDGDALYVGFWGWDSEPRLIRASAMARDFSWGADDNFELVLDTFDDDRTGYLFVTNPNGARADALIADNGGTTNRDWDGVWDVRAQRNGEGWFAEFRIPFSTLRFRPGDALVWGVNFERNIRRKREQVLWQGWSRDYDLEQVSHAGRLEGIAAIGGTTLLEARPHLIGGVAWDEGEDRQSVDHVGLDLNWLAGPSWKLNVTVRPDFAQVESDREEVNLTRFSLFYPEKRTFFLEGSEFFQFELGSDAQPFYSRTIGLAPDRTEIPITGGIRVLGREGGTTLGAMALRTEAKDTVPATDFGVVRWKHDVLDESSVGILAVARREPGRTNLTWGTDLLYSTSGLFGEKQFEAGVTLAQTYASDAAERFGLAHRLYVDYPNDLVEFSASWLRVDSAFDPEAGYLRRASFQRFGAELAVSPRPRFIPFLQQLEFKPFELSWYQDDRTGDLQTLYAEVVPLAFTLRSGDSFEFNVQRRADHPTETFELFEDAEIAAGEYWFTRWAADLSSFSSRPLSGGIEISGGDFYLGTRLEAGLNARWKINPHLSLSGDWAWNRIDFEDQSFRVHEAAARVDFAVSPNLFGAVASQWNNEDDEAILNFRLNWIPTPGSDLFLVINQIADARDRAWTPLRTTLLSKLVWRVTF
jgi:hypothetical protein